MGATLIMMALTLLASGVNYASNLVFSRVLTPAGYGDFTALIALTVIDAVPAAPPRRSSPTDSRSTARLAIATRSPT
jgi:hypothetical protein